MGNEGILERKIRVGSKKGRSDTKSGGFPFRCSSRAGPERFDILLAQSRMIAEIACSPPYHNSEVPQRGPPSYLSDFLSFLLIGQVRLIFDFPPVSLSGYSDF
ncbi:hypothetical protein HPP92_006930 [Vanilla planifolia]|uniref:Uncharacterized protein n=1 Tax=Vanilla planifolia TaxID=51239 RepID=A0A835RQC5_VANPL|nr:hypothetical protein HPP92_006930 [Vanilla planifolia]